MENAGQNTSPLKGILSIGLIAGTLDGLAAVIFLGKMNFVGVFQYIASAIFGKDAYTGGYGTAFLGLIFHYLIALSFSIIFMLVSKQIPLLRRNIILSGIFYGIIVWAIMNFIVVPLTKIPHTPFNYQRAFVNCIILIFCIGLPISYLTARKLNKG